ncbi:MAG: hypothetical protein AB1331_04215 [Bacillota bacterium]
MSIGDPFVANIPRKMTTEELLNALRVDIHGGLEAIVVYDAHILGPQEEQHFPKGVQNVQQVLGGQ